jgi:hypothetical protein
VDRLAFWLEGYDESQKHYLVEGFRSGFKVGFVGSPHCQISSNLVSAQAQPSRIDEYITGELAANRVRGPFNKPPFDEFQCSPLGLVPKKDPGKLRVIHHLSYPEGGSVNDHIPPENTQAAYQSVDDAIQMITNVGKAGLLSKTEASLI